MFPITMESIWGNYAFAKCQKLSYFCLLKEFNKAVFVSSSKQFLTVSEKYECVIVSSLSNLRYIYVLFTRLPSVCRIANNWALQQAHRFGAMDHQRSQYYVMHAGLGGGQREHLQTIHLYMLELKPMIVRINGLLGWRAYR